MLRFDEEFYLSRNGDVLLAVRNGLFRDGHHHFSEFGASELRDPHPLFSSRYYLTENPDVAAAVGSGLFPSGWGHFISFGLHEGRVPSAGLAGFHDDIYRAANPDVDQAIRAGLFSNGLSHYMAFGAAEGRLSGLADVTLTRSADTLTANQFHAPLLTGPGGGPPASSLGSDDHLTGFGSNPTLTATLGQSTANATVIRPHLSGITTLDLTFEKNGGVVGLDRATGITTIRLSGVTDMPLVTLRDLGEATARHFEFISLNQASDVLIQYGDDVLAADDDTATVLLQDSQLDQLTIRGAGGGIETLTVESRSSLADSAVANSFAALDMPGLVDLLLVGDHGLDVDVTWSPVQHVLAGAMQADVSIKAGPAITNVVLGGGNDRLILDIDPGVADGIRGLNGRTITGGDGLDQLVLVTQNAVHLDQAGWSGVSGFERIDLTGSHQARYFVNLSNDVHDANAGRHGLDIHASGLAVTLDLTALTGQRAVRFHGDVGNNHFIVAMDQLPAYTLNGGNSASMLVYGQGNASLGNVSNVNRIGFVGEGTQGQPVTLLLDDSTVDRLVDARTTSTVAAPDRLVIDLGLAGPVNGVIEGRYLSARSALDVAAGAGDHALRTGDGADRILLLPDADATIASGAGNDELIIVGNFATGSYSGYRVLDYQVSQFANDRSGAATPVITGDLGDGIDVIRSFGSLNMAGVTITGYEKIIAHSALVLTASQYRDLIARADAAGYTGEVIAFSGQDIHQLRIIGDDGPSLDLSRIAMRNAGTAAAVENMTMLFIDFRKENGDDMPSLPFGIPQSTSGESGLVVVGVPVSLDPTNGVVDTVLITGPGDYDGRDGKPTTFITAPWLTSLAGVTITGGAGENDLLIMTFSLSSGSLGDHGQGGVVTGLGGLVQSGNLPVTMVLPADMISYSGSNGGDTLDASGWAPVAGHILLGSGDDRLTGVQVGLLGQVTLSGGCGYDEISLTGLDGAPVNWGAVYGFETIDFGTPSQSTEVNGLPDDAVSTLRVDTTLAPLVLYLSADELAQLSSVEFTGGNGVTIRLTDEGDGIVDLSAINFHGNGALVTLDLTLLAGGNVGVVIGDTVPVIIGQPCVDHLLQLSADLGTGATLPGLSDMRIAVSSAHQSGLTLPDDIEVFVAMDGGSIRTGDNGIIFLAQGEGGFTLRGGSGDDSFLIATEAGVSNTILLSGGRDEITLSLESGVDIIHMGSAAGAHDTTSSADFFVVQNFDITEDRIFLDGQHMGNITQPGATALGRQIPDNSANSHIGSFDIMRFSSPTTERYSGLDLAAPLLNGQFVLNYMQANTISYSFSPGHSGYFELSSQTDPADGPVEQAMYLYYFNNDDAIGSGDRLMTADDLQLVGILDEVTLPADFGEWINIFAMG